MKKTPDVIPKVLLKAQKMASVVSFLGLLGRNKSLLKWEGDFTRVRFHM